MTRGALEDPTFRGLHTKVYICVEIAIALQNGSRASFVYPTRSQSEDFKIRLVEKNGGAGEE